MTDPTEPTGLKSQRYELLNVIGSGGQGVVYRAFDHWTQRPVAIKVMGSQAARQPQMAERLSREQQALTVLKGTAAVEMLDVYRGKDGELCLVMELLVGTNLDAFLQELEAKNERMELFRVAEIFDPVVDTLEVAHKAGVLHRDLKPANVFLLEDGGVRLLDFGMTRLRTSTPLTAEGTVMGSPSFMAPEAWKGQSAAVDHRADVYSFGVILFRVIAGDLPFSGLSLYEKMIGSTKSERPSLHAKRPDLPRDVDEWVQLALAIDREQRFQNVRALWNAFFATFHVEAPERGKRSSFWAKAKGKAKQLAGIADSARSADPPSTGDAPIQAEPSFITQALRRSMPNAPQELTPFDGPTSSAEATIQIVKPPVAPATNPPEQTIELGDDEFSPAPPSFHRPRAPEKTVEVSGTDFFVEDTLPDPALDDTLPGQVRGEATLPSGTRVDFAAPDYQHVEKTLPGVRLEPRPPGEPRPRPRVEIVVPETKAVSSRRDAAASSKKGAESKRMRKRKGRGGKGRSSRKR